MSEFWVLIMHTQYVSQKNVTKRLIPGIISGAKSVGHNAETYKGFDIQNTKVWFIIWDTP